MTNEGDDYGMGYYEEMYGLDDKYPDDEYRICPSCDGGLTETDYSAGYCTQCGWELEGQR